MKGENVEGGKSDQKVTEERKTEWKYELEM